MNSDTVISYALRVDVTQEHDEELKIYLENLDGGCMATLEMEHENRHVHVLFYSSKKIQALRTQLIRKLPWCVGNAGYSMSKVTDLQKYKAYICKGDGPEDPPQHFYHKGVEFGETWINEHHTSYYLMPCRAPKRNLIEYVEAEAKRQCLAWTDRSLIAQIYIKELVLQKKSINFYSVKNAVNLIECLLCPDDAAINNISAGI